MAQLSLADYGLRLFAGRLYNHDYLWFSSTEISRVSASWPVLHNYALTYALSHFSYGLCINPAPTYFEDMRQMPLYCTPASALWAERTTITYNAVDTLTQQTSYQRGRSQAEKQMNTPMLGKRVYLNPLYEAPELERPEHGYAFYAFVFDGSRPRAVTRLGKKGCPVRIRWEEISYPMAEYRDELTQPTHPVNPLDVTGELRHYDPVSIPPHLILQAATIIGDWFIIRGQHRVHLPKFVRERMGL